MRMWRLQFTSSFNYDGTNSSLMFNLRGAVMWDVIGVLNLDFIFRRGIVITGRRQVDSRRIRDRKKEILTCSHEKGYTVTEIDNPVRNKSEVWAVKLLLLLCPLAAVTLPWSPSPLARFLVLETVNWCFNQHCILRHGWSDANYIIYITSKYLSDWKESVWGKEFLSFEIHFKMHKNFWEP